MAGATELEPAASAVTGQRSNQLSYAPAGVGVELKGGPPQVKARGRKARRNYEKALFNDKNRWSRAPESSIRASVWRSARPADLQEEGPHMATAPGKAPATVTLKHLAAALADTHEMSEEAGGSSARRSRRQHRQASEEGRAYPHRRARHPSGAQARRPHGPQSGDRRADPDQGLEEGRLPRFQGT